MYTVAFTLGVLLVYSVWRVFQIGRRPAGMPPGPPTLPIYGNYHEYPPWHLHLKFSEWARKYGPLVTIMRGGQANVLVSDAKAARDLFDKMGTITSSRSDEYLTVDVASDGYAIAFQPAGPSWRRGRKLFHSILNVGATRRYLPYQELESTKLVCDILDDPENWWPQIFRYNNSIGLLLTTGRRVPRADDPDIEELLKNFREFGLITINGGLLDYFPLLRRLPYWLFPSARRARKHCTRHSEIALKHYLPSKDHSNPRSILPSFNKSLAERQETEGFPNLEGARWGLDLLSAATETSASTLVNLFAVMALYPEAQRKAHEELDRIVGAERTPNYSDFLRLPYIRQIVQELHRWSSVAPFGIPHANSKPITYAGYTIPAGSTLILNAWYIHNDPAIYPEPRAFKPERWEGKLQEDKEDSVGARSELFAFGAGRRICPGQHLADKNLFLSVCKILWACQIRKAIDEQGREIDIDAEKFAIGATLTLAEFAVAIKPRSEKRREMMRSEWNKGREEFLD